MGRAGAFGYGIGLFGQQIPGGLEGGCTLVLTFTGVTGILWCGIWLEKRYRLCAGLAVCHVEDLIYGYFKQDMLGSLW
jgi:hypothetical protein